MVAVPSTFTLVYMNVIGGGRKHSMVVLIITICLIDLYLGSWCVRTGGRPYECKKKCTLIKFLASIITIAFCRVRMCIMNASLGKDLCLCIEPVLFLLYQHTVLPSLPTRPASRTLLKGRIAACTRQLDEVFEWVKFFSCATWRNRMARNGETANIGLLYRIHIYS